MTTVIKIEAVSAKVESFGGAVQVTTEVELADLFGLFEWSVIREYFEEQIEDELTEARQQGRDEDRDMRSFEAEQRSRMRNDY